MVFNISKRWSVSGGNSSSYYSNVSDGQSSSKGLNVSVVFNISKRWSVSGGDSISKRWSVLKFNLEK